MENLNIALLLMVVGMATVFAILLIVIYLGKAMIALVNKYAPEEAVAAKKEGPAPIPANIMAAISAAVAVVTHDKGKVTLSSAWSSGTCGRAPVSMFPAWTSW